MNLTATLIIQSLVLLILGWITMKFIWPPLIAAIEDRQRKIAEGLAAADKGEKSLAEAQTSAADIVKEARVQAGKIADQAHRRSTEMIDEAKSAAIAEGQRLVGDARQEAALEKSRVRDQLRAEVGSLAIAGAAQVLGREIDARAHADLIEQLARQIEQTGERG
ncbi:MAG: F0F1 ATP synthase subunit B [Steroidobacteraceae bacterium]